MKRHLLVSLVVLPLAFGSFLVAADTSKGVKPANSPAARVLALMAGNWDEEVEMADGRKVKGTTTARFVMDGNWLESESDIVIDDKNRVLHLSLTGWDEKAMAFKGWMFSPTGEPLVSTATYDEKTKLFTSKGTTSAGATVDVVTDLTTPDKQTWTVTITNKEGQAIKFKGVNTRKKEESK